MIANAVGQFRRLPNIHNPWNSNYELLYLNLDFDRKFGKRLEGAGGSMSSEGSNLRIVNQGPRRRCGSASVVEGPGDYMSA